MNIIPWRRGGASVPRMLDLDDLWGRLWSNGEEDLASRLPAVFRERPFPAVNIAETEDSFRITMDCPGLEERDFQVELMGNRLLISGERSWEKDKQGQEYRRVESQFGRFERAVELPETARFDPREIQAKYERGVLSVRVPKQEQTPAKKIPVHAG